MGGYHDLVILESIEMPLRSRVCECERQCLNERVTDLVEDWIVRTFMGYSSQKILSAEIA